MKKIISIFALLLVTTTTYASISPDESITFFKGGEPKKYASLEELLKNEDNITNVTDGCNNGTIGSNGTLIMTEMYCENIYGVNGKEIWQKTDGRITIYGEDATYLIEKLYNNLYNSKYTDRINFLIKDKSTKYLNSKIDYIDEIIKDIKSEDINKIREDQNKNITALLYIKGVIEDNLDSKK